jgi:hypothetical protein
VSADEAGGSALDLLLLLVGVVAEPGDVLSSPIKRITGASHYL